MSNSQEKFIQNWDKIRKLGKWKYILKYGFIFIILFSLISYSIDYFKGELNSNSFEIKNIIIKIIASIIGAFIYGLLTWYIYEARFNKLKSKQNI